MARYLIIGAGPAGISAAEAIRSQDQGGEIILITEDPYGYYSRPGLAYLLTGEIPKSSLYPFSSEDYRRLSLRLLNVPVARVDPLEHRIINPKGQAMSYDRLLIATGSTAVLPSFPGAGLDGTVKLDDMADVRKIMKLARRGNTAVVVGGGITALEIMEGLLSRGVKVHYFFRGDRYWSNVLDETESRIVEHLLHEDGAKIHYQTEITEVLGKKGRVMGVRTNQNEMIRCDLVAMAIGVRPRTELAVSSGIQVDRGIVVNEYLQASQPDIFAAGDVAQVYDPLTGISILDTLWGPARQQGFVAGLNMAGKVTPFRKPPAFNVTRLAGLTTTIIGTVGKGRDLDVIGIARGDSEAWRQLPDSIAAQENFEVNRLRILVSKQTLIGAVVMGSQAVSPVLQRLIVSQTDISPIREKLLLRGAPLADLLTHYWRRIDDLRKS